MMTNIPYYEDNTNFGEENLKDFGLLPWSLNYLKLEVFEENILETFHLMLRFLIGELYEV